MHDQQTDPIAEAFVAAAVDGGGRPTTFDVPENTTIKFGDPSPPSHLLDGAQLTAWVDSFDPLAAGRSQ